MLLSQDKDGNILTTQVEVEYEIYRKGASEGVVTIDELRAVRLYKDYCKMYPENEIQFMKRVKEITTKIIDHDLSDLSMEQIEEMEKDALKNSLDNFYSDEMGL